MHEDYGYKNNMTELEGHDEKFPSDFVDRLFEGKNKIRVWLDYRGLTTEQLAARVGLSHNDMLDVMNKKRGCSFREMKAIAQALNTNVDLIV